MLVLSRYIDESIYIGDDVVITVIDVRGDRVRIGIQAPADVAVHRKEIYDAIQREKGTESTETRQTATKQAEMKQERPKKAPLAQKLAESKRQGLPVDINSPIEFGGFGDVMPR